MTGLDRTDLRTALVAANYYTRAHALIKRPVPDAAIRLIDNLQQALSSSGHPEERPQPQLMTVKQLAEQRGCSTRHARRIATRIGHRFGRQWLIPVDAIEEQE